MSKEFLTRWYPAHVMWTEGVPRATIARYYGISDKALGTRIQRWRKSTLTSWMFPPRQVN